MILYIIIDVICLQGILKAPSESCLYKLQNAVIAGPAHWGIRDQIT